MSAARRWPLHPQPGPLESLSSWLDRLGRLYRLPVKDLLTHNLGQLDVIVPEVVDWDPPAGILAALAERTGTGLAQLRAMTLAGCGLLQSMTIRMTGPLSASRSEV